jgi:D-lactate dehydrogenase
MKIVHFNLEPIFFEKFSQEKTCLSIDAFKQIPEYENIEVITITPKSRITSEILENFPSVKLIVTRSVGFDHIDLDSCKNRNIAVYHIDDYGSYHIAEHALALLLSGTKNIIKSQNNIKKGKFSDAPFVGISLKNKIVGIVGTGKIGLEFIKRLTCFDCKVIAYDIIQNQEMADKLKYSYVSLEELLAKSDIISLHAPLTPQTYHMINDDTISKMKDQVILINTARGGLIDTQSLIRNCSKFFLIGLDVIENEKQFNQNNPLLNLDNVVITPHIAYLTQESIAVIVKKTYECVDNFQKGISENRLV